MLTDVVKYWLAVGAIMLVMWGYTGGIATPLLFGIAGAGAFVYWRITAQRQRQALDAARNAERPRGA